ncbi:MAG: VPLPA-CTERM sorting domain-containing protein [Telluria sp.]
MPSLAKFFPVLALAVPAAALADPITFTIHTSGSMKPIPIVTDQLGMQLPDPGRPAQYALTMVTTFDPAATDFQQDVYGVYQNDARIDLTFVFAGLSYSYHGIGEASVSRAPNDWGYVQDACVPAPSSGQVFFTNVVSPNYGGYFAALLDPTNYTSSGYGIASLWPPGPANQMAGDEESASVQVVSNIVSTVPEPASAGMLLGGMLALGCWRRRRQ